MYEGTKKVAQDVAQSVGNYKTMMERNDANTMNPQMYESYQRSVQDSFGNYKVSFSSMETRNKNELLGDEFKS